jgi:uncharacterized protein YfiM (DUF2279 family)
LRRIGLAGVALALICAATPARGQAGDSSTSRPAPAGPRDSFIGLDKPKHFLLSFFIESAAFASFQAAGAGRRSAESGATATAAIFGLGREIHDQKTKGLFSFGDLFWDALGAGAAVVMLRHTYR